MQNKEYEEPLVRKHRDSPTTYTHYLQHLKTLQTKQTTNQIEPLKLLLYKHKTQRKILKSKRVTNLIKQYRNGPHLMRKIKRSFFLDGPIL